MNGREMLLALARKFNNNWDKIYDIVKSKTLIDDLDFFEIDNEHAITLFDVDYPDCLKQTSKPPFVIYYDGDISALKDKNLIYLLGNNDFDFPINDIVTNDVDKVCIGNKLKIWTDGSQNENIKLACAIANKLVITKTLQKASKDFIAIDLMVSAGKDIYVKPTATNSENNYLIKEFANLADCKEDINNESNKLDF